MEQNQHACVSVINILYRLRKMAYMHVISYSCDNVLLRIYIDSRVYRLCTLLSMVYTILGLLHKQAKCACRK